MALFKFRKGADESASATVQPQSLEAIRQRAKYRLAGAVVLVLAAVVGLPLLFDQQPRPMAVDLPVVIPDKNKVAALAIPAAPRPANPPAPGATPAPASTPAPAPTPEPLPPAPVTVPAPVPAGPASPAPAATVAKPAAPVKPDTASTPPNPALAAKVPVNRAQALLEGRADADKAASSSKTPAVLAAPPDSAAKSAPEQAERFVVQVGAFADNARAREVRLKVERAGLKTYTHVAETKDGRRIRVRVGPFTARAEAEKAADKIKKLNLPAALLTL